MQIARFLRTTRFLSKIALFFHGVVTPVACFAAGHRIIFKQKLAALDVAHRKLLCRVVGPPAGMDWSRLWHEILHDWNVGISIFVGQAGLKPWSHTCSEQHWKLGHYAVNSPCDKWYPVCCIGNLLDNVVSVAHANDGTTC